MILAWAFWLLLFLPGACLQRRLRPEGTASVFETIAVSYLWSLLLLAPLLVVGHALTVPLAVFSSGVAVAILVGLVITVRDMRAGRLRVQVRAEHVVTLLLVAYFLLQAAGVGGHIGHDGDFHLARIRLLYDRGLTNADPHTGTGFSHPYHTNMLHALVAAGSQLTRMDPIALWQSTLPWAKLVTASGIATLCVRLGGGLLATSTAVAAFLGSMFISDWVLYPNQLGPYWLVPVGLGACAGLFATEHRRYFAWVLGASAFSLGIVHGLYAGFLAVLGAAAIVTLAAYRVLTRRDGTRSMLPLVVLGGALLATPAPSLYFARYAHQPAQPNFDYQGGEPTPRQPKRARHIKELKADEAGRFSIPAERALGGPSDQVLVAAALLVMLARRRTAAALTAVATLGTCLVLLHVPAVGGLALQLIGAPWMLERLLEVVLALKLAVLCAGLVPAWPSGRVLAHLAGLLPAIVALVATGFDPREQAAEQRQKLATFASRIELIEPFSAEPPWPIVDDQEVARRIPPGSVVLTHPLAARQLRKLHHMYFVRASRNHTGVDDLLDRTRDMHLLQYGKGSIDELLAVLRKYRIRYALQKSDHPIGWLKKQPVVAETDRIKLIDLQPLLRSKRGREK